MFSNIRKLAVAGLLLLSGAATAPIEAAPIEARDGLHHLKLDFFSFKDAQCQKQKQRIHTMQSGKCTSFHHSFHAFYLETSPRWDETRQYWSKFGKCKFTLYTDKHCAGEVLAVDDINGGNGKYVKQCHAVDDGNSKAKARSAKIVCIKDGEQVDEVEMDL